MKSPAELASKLARQWHDPTLRVQRLLSAAAWPLEIAIGRPSGRTFASDTAAVQAHVQRWRAIGVGEVVMAPIRYRASSQEIPMPVTWRLRSPSEWVCAADDEAVHAEFDVLERLVSRVDEIFRELLVRERVLWRDKPLDEVVQAALLASTLTPGAACGRPLRMLAGQGVDTKFFDRHGRLLTRLLDQRFQGTVSDQGLPAFLGAHPENDHWVLFLALDDHLLPFRRLRVTTQTLSEIRLPGSHLIVIENERCEHVLPRLPGTLAVLGAGLDLNWLASPTLAHKAVAYWGDMDTWGLSMLAKARAYCPTLTPLMMTQQLFDRYAQQNAVVEPVAAQPQPPPGLTQSEAAFYQYLLHQATGRLEQEYLPEVLVKSAILRWHDGNSVSP